MSILVVRRGIQGPRGLSGLAARETLIAVANIEAIKTVADNIDIIAAADFSAENITYDHDTSGLTAINAQDALDEIAVSLEEALEAIQASVPPVGSLLSYAGAIAPTGYLLCYGQEVSRTTYANLFTVISSTYGEGDGSTTFNLPDLRGRVIAGQDNMGGTSANRLTDQVGGVDGDLLGDTGGAETHTLSTAQMPLHGHPFTLSLGTGVITSGSLAVGLSSNTQCAAYTGTPSQTQGQQIGGSGGGGAHNNVQPTIILSYIIKY